MKEILCLAFALTMFLIGFCLGMVVAAEKNPLQKTLDTLRSDTEEFVRLVEAQEATEAFEVAGKPRRPSWKQRRKELEAAARTKRKRIEEWRD